MNQTTVYEKTGAQSGLVLASAEQQYLKIMKDIIDLSEADPDRTGVGRARVFARDIHCDISDGTVPVITTRKINVDHGIEELLWMIRGSSNLKDLADNTKVIWADWAVKEEHILAFIAKHAPELDGEAKDVLVANMKERFEDSIGPMYGKLWRNNPCDQNPFLPVESILLEDIPSDKLKYFGECYDEEHFLAKAAGLITDEDDQHLKKERYIKMRYLESGDQLGEIIRGIKRRPFSARHCLSVWDPRFVPFEGALSPQENVLVGRGALSACHVLSQFFVEKAKDGGPNWLSLRMTQRSCDLALGVCTNLVFYSVLLHLVAHCTGLRPKRFIWSGGDIHLYASHLEKAKEQVGRMVLGSPSIRINPEVRDLFAIKREDIEIVDYLHHPFIKYPIAV